MSAETLCYGLNSEKSVYCYLGNAQNILQECSIRAKKCPANGGEGLSVRKGPKRT